MGTVTITPTFTDYTNGAPWSSLGGAQAGAQAALTQVCTDYSTALATPAAFGNMAFTIDFGLGARGPGGQPGTPIGGGANSAPPFFNVYTYQQIRTALLALTGTTAFQQSAWNTTNLPSTTPGLFTGPFAVYPTLEWLLGFNSETQGSTLGFVGMGLGTFNDTDLHGLGAGVNWYAGGFHEVGEMVGRLDPIIIWAFTSAGNRFIPDDTTATYFSVDNGTTNLVNFNTSGGGDTTDLNSGGDPYHSFIFSGACSRSAILPGRAVDWKILATVGWLLTPAGQVFAGLSLPQTAALSLGCHT